MSPASIILALFLLLSLLPLGWNKVDTALHASLIYGLGALLAILLALSWKELTTQEFNWRKKFSLSNLIRISALALALTFAISKFTSPIQNFGWSEVAVLIGGVGIFFIIQSWKDAERKKLLAVILILGVISALFGLAQYLYRPESRIAGPFFVTEFASSYWPNAFATLLLMVWPLALMLQKRVIKILSLTIFLTALLLTFSRAALLVLIMQLMILAYIERKTLFAFVQKRTFSSSIKTLVATLLATLLLTGGLHTIRPLINTHETNGFVKKITFAGSESQTSIGERFDFMMSALELTWQHPFLGSGPFSFRYIYPKIQKDFLAISDHPHNWFLKIGLEEGIPALLLFMLLIVGVMGSQIFQKEKESKDCVPSTILLLSLSGSLLHSLADYNMNFLTNQMIFWIVLGVAVSPMYVKKWPQKDNNSHSITVFSGLVAIMICATVASIGYEGYLSFTKKNFERMQFSRNYFLEMSGDALQKNDLASAKKYASIQVQKNPYDAFAWNMLGQIAEREASEASFGSRSQNSATALHYYEKAVQLDPANFFNLYYDYIRLARAMNRTDTAAYADIAAAARKWLTAYPEKIKQNIHYTAQTSNPGHAAALAKQLGEMKLALRIQRALRDFHRSRPAKT